MGDAHRTDTGTTLTSLAGERSSERARVLGRGEVIGRYVVIDRVGEGGMGVVYAAYDPELDRKLALKLLHHDIGDRAEARRTRLVREAQAMARLTHRNVIVVHDVGTLDDQVFVAMEFIDGESLASWLATPRPWREVLGVMVQAGRGLEAAHAAGLVHRDFKPDNVMIAAGGRVVVTDFGLARAAGGSDDSAVGPSPIVEARAPGRGPLSATVTAAGAIMGTPAYMAPEQHEGRIADARSDQFAFAVVLYEALWHQRPFPGEDFASLAYSVTAGNVRTPPGGSQVPGWLERVVLRALALAPERRYPSMNALLDELTRDRTWRPRWWAIAASVGAAAVTGAYAGWVLDPEPAPCAAGAAHVEPVWNPARARAIRSRFAATGLSYAEEQWPAIEAELDVYARDWLRGYVDACEATHVRGEQSEALLDARMLCLGGRLDELAAAVDLLETADASVVERALATVQGLPRLRACANTESLLDPVPPPDDPAIAAEVMALRPELAKVGALQRAGVGDVGLPAARALVDRARETDYQPIVAESLILLARLEDDRGEVMPAQGHLREAITAALRGRADRLAARAAVALVDVLGRDRAAALEAESWAELADALLARTGGDAELEVELFGMRADSRRAAGDWAGARVQLEGLVATLERAHGSEDARVADATVELADALVHTGELERARSLLERAVAVDEYAVGLDHPKTAAVFARLGNVCLELGDLDGAIEHLERAIAIGEAAHGSEGPELVEPLVRAAQAFVARAQSIAAHVPRLAPGERAGIELGLGELALDQGDAAAALDHSAAAQTVLGSAGDSERSAAADALAAEALLALGRANEAGARARAALTLVEREQLREPRLRARIDDALRRSELGVAQR